MQRPTESEFIPAAKNYIDLVPEGKFLDLMEQNKTQIISFFSAIPSEKENFRYSEKKWTIKQTLLHMADTERVMSFRALALSRGDVEAEFCDMDEKLYASNADPSSRSLEDILKEFITVRDASVFLFKYLSDEHFGQVGSLFGYPVTPRGFGYIIIGHALHHINIVRTRYLS